ncbi:MAG TPA: histidine kinase [Thermoanaerobaculia bacterium]|nr:histidine kinase [Thermoanaerobaculia bacterium]
MPRLLQIAGLMVWVMVALPVIIQGGANSTSLMIGWAIAYLLFAALFIADLRWPRLSLLAMQAACVVVVVAILCDGFEGTLLVLIAMQLGIRVSRKTGLIWIAVQTTLLAAAIAIHWNGRAAFLLTPPYFGFQLLAFFTFQIVEREARMKERLRIAQDLHDSLGHHLTALTLNLESALLREGAEARADVEKAQSLARGLLADVREIVADSEPVDVEASLKELATNVPRPRVHLQVEEGLTLSHVILRCAQEIVTNAARHSAAENLWITIERSQGHLQLRAHDDGRGSDASPDGFGLRGMRARVEAAGGELQIVNQPGRGFGVIAILP